MLQLTNDYLTASFTTKGAELTGLYDKNKVVEYIWQADPNVWGRHAPILFPIVGQLFQNTLNFRDNQYSLSQHGFARDMEFTVQSHNDHQIVFLLTNDNHTKTKYPFDFELKVIYTMYKKSLSIGYEVINPRNENLYFSIGAHTGLRCPFLEATNFEDYIIKFETPEKNVKRLLFDNGLTTGEMVSFDLCEGVIQLSHELFAKDAIILEGLESGYCILQSKTQPHFGIKYHFEGFPLVAFWTKPNAQAPFICIEPWYGIADTHGFQGSFDQKSFIQCLAPFESFECEHIVEIL